MDKLWISDIKLIVLWLFEIRWSIVARLRYVRKFVQSNLIKIRMKLASLCWQIVVSLLFEVITSIPQIWRKHNLVNE